MKPGLASFPLIKSTVTCTKPIVSESSNVRSVRLSSFHLWVKRASIRGRTYLCQILLPERTRSNMTF